MRMHKKLGRAVFSLFSAAALSVLGGSLSLGATLPDSFTVAQGQEFSLPQSSLPLRVSAVQAVDGTNAAQTASSAGSSYSVKLSLPGGIAVKTVKVDVVQRQSVVPGGQPFGIKMFTNGVMVINTGDVQSENGVCNPAKDAGIQVGDVILCVNGRHVRSNEDFASLIDSSNGDPVNISLMREEQTQQVTLTPVADKTSGAYRVGLWVRDSSAGIGTVTFYDPTSLVFGGLGHAVCDVDTGEILPLMSGEMAPVEVTGCTKGKCGIPGELSGAFLSEEKLGDLKLNTQTGLFGQLGKLPQDSQDTVEVAMRQEVHTGDAVIRSTVDSGEVKEYAITIEKVDYSEESPTKNLQVRVTDPELLEKTGGIVQGMSGSPILQDGRLVGAVTHVFVNDPTRGYGIFAENMLDTAQKVQSQS